MKSINNSLHYIFISRLYLKLKKAEYFKIGRENIRSFRIFLSTLRRIRYFIKNVLSPLMGKKFKKLRNRINILEKLLSKFLSFEILVKDFYSIKKTKDADFSSFEDIILTIQNSFYFQRLNLLKNYDYLVLKKELVTVIWSIKNLEFDINKKRIKYIFYKFKNKFENFIIFSSFIRNDSNDKNIKMFRKYFIQIRFLMEYFFAILKVGYVKNNFIKINTILSKIKNIKLILKELTKIATETRVVNVLKSITDIKEYYISLKNKLIENLIEEIDNKLVFKIEKFMDNIKEIL